MKLIFFTYLLLSSAIYADYFNHPDSKKIIDDKYNNLTKEKAKEKTMKKQKRKIYL